MILAAQNDHREVVEILIAKRINVNIQAKNGQSAIFAAAKKNFREVAVSLIAAGADLNLQVSDTVTLILT